MVPLTQALDAKHGGHVGLAISVGDFAAMHRDDPESAEWFENQIHQINTVLVQHGHVEHVEPLDVPELEYNCVTSFPYSFLHYLRRAYARKALGKAITPVAGDDLSEEDDADVERVTEACQSHLLYHSDCEGFYIPIDFPAPLVDDDITGGALGSTQGLLREILTVAPDLGIVMDGSDLSEISRVDLEACDEAHPFYIERIVWQTLYENCKLSMKYGSLISFG
jgi:hypothetical protein